MRMRIDPMTVYGICFVIFLYAPVLLIPLFSFNDSTVATFPMKGFTLNGYRLMAADASLMNAPIVATPSDEWRHRRPSRRQTRTPAHVASTPP